MASYIRRFRSNRSSNPISPVAPEVANPNFPEQIPRDNEGAQVIDTTAPETAPSPIQPDGPLGGFYAPASPDGGDGGDDEHDGDVADGISADKSRRSKRSSRLLILSIVIAILALAGGIGIGVGIGISVAKSNNADAQQCSSSGTANPDTSPTQPSSNPSSTSYLDSIATGDISGVALYSCQDQTKLYSYYSVPYITDCSAAYLTGGPDLYFPAKIIANVSEPPYTRYTINDCINLCDEYNSYWNHDDQPCRAVTYYANLTQAYGVGWMGNCFLKSGVPKDITRPGEYDIVDWRHTMSAYQSCLKKGDCS